MSEIVTEINRRRAFATVSHSDAVKTTLTEKFLLFGGAIHIAGAVKSNKIKKDNYFRLDGNRKTTRYFLWTQLIVVTIVVDIAKSVEVQISKLIEVCRMRSTPVMIFVN